MFPLHVCWFRDMFQAPAQLHPHQVLDSTLRQQRELIQRMYFGAKLWALPPWLSIKWLCVPNLELCMPASWSRGWRSWTVFIGTVWGPKQWSVCTKPLQQTRLRVSSEEMFGLFLFYLASSDTGSRRLWGWPQTSGPGRPLWLTNILEITMSSSSFSQL